MQIREIKNKTTWNSFLLASPAHDRLFLQSWEWGECLRAEGQGIERLAIHDDAGALVAQALAVERTLFGNKKYIFLPYGPVMSSPDLMPSMLALLRQRWCASRPQVVFIRVEPATAVTGVGQRVKEIHPVETSLLDLTQPVEVLPTGMHAKTRYNIKVAKRHGVVVAVSNAAADFLRLMKMTSARDKFTAHSDQHYSTLLKQLGVMALPSAAARELAVTIFVARRGEQVLAAAMVAVFGDTATYLHGASSNTDRQLMAPYLLHWEIIQRVQALGYRQYDWWGVNTTGTRPDWAGITRFKQGFGGHIKEYGGTYDLICQSQWYRMYAALRWLKKLSSFNG